jgi:hypothetical protein
MFLNGAWRSPVARMLWEHDVAGSNPAAPTNHNKGLRAFVAPFLCRKINRAQYVDSIDCPCPASQGFELAHCKKEAE